MNTQIVGITFVSDWLTPQNITMKVCDVLLKNGESGRVYIPESNFLKFVEGAEVVSMMKDGKLSIKLPDTPKPPPQKPNQNTKPQSGGFQQQQHTITYYLGFSMGFAKDMLIEEFKKDPKAKQFTKERFEQLCIDAYDVAEKLFNKSKEK